MSLLRARPGPSSLEAPQPQPQPAMGRWEKVMFPLPGSKTAQPGRTAHPRNQCRGSSVRASRNRGPVACLELQEAPGLHFNCLFASVGQPQTTELPATPLASLFALLESLYPVIMSPTTPSAVLQPSHTHGTAFISLVSWACPFPRAQGLSEDGGQGSTATFPTSCPSQLGGFWFSLTTHATSLLVTRPPGSPAAALTTLLTPSSLLRTLCSP